MQVTYTVGGLQQAQNLLNRTTSRLATLALMAGAAQDAVSLSSEAVTLLQAKTDFQANLRALKATDEMQESALEALKPEASGPTTPAAPERSPGSA